MIKGNQSIQHCWKKAVQLALIGLSLALLSACGKSQTGPDTQTEHQSHATTSQRRSNMSQQAITMTIDGRAVTVQWEDGQALEALKVQLSAGSLTLDLSAYGGFEQVGDLGFALPSQDQQQTAQSGDIMLYNSKSLVLFHGQNSWAYTKLGHIEDSQVTSLLDKDSVRVTLSLGGTHD